MKNQINRRAFLQSAGVGVAGLWLGGCQTASRSVAANERLNLGVVGVANQGQYNLNQVATENIVALCDVDETFLNAAAEKFPAATRYRDFRRLLERRDLDAVVVATPDHTHAVVAVNALRSGRHVYCEKPLARTISEVRIITETARKMKLATQIGTQIHAGANYRRVVELVQSGAIGDVNEVHVWVAATYGGQELPRETPPIPAGLDYDLWLGPVPWRAYSPEYVPFKWRNWWAFGGGALADFGCHFMDLPHWALGLSHPDSAEVVEGPPVHAESTPPWLIVRYTHPRRGAQPPVTLTWYHGGKRPELPAGTEDFEWRSGVLFVGSRGQLISDYGRHTLLPAAQFDGFQRPEPFIPESIGHHQEWIRACKTGAETTCGFAYSGPLTEAALLGNVAYRTGRRIGWDWKRQRALGDPAAQAYIEHTYRKGWSI
ncbi:MAG: Gfo/Idh/MocA family oxidoreductase [Verrucomicrobia bacterium]|nr:Gfo/Idh/MocA family oxidoreductase [Verrucomicrobiota bacterium]